MKKSILYILLLLLAPLCVNAQTPASTGKVQRLEFQISSSVVRPQRLFMAQAEKTFEVTLDLQSKVINASPDGDLDVMFTGHIRNLLNTAQHIGFYRDQKLAPFWFSQVRRKAP